MKVKLIQVLMTNYLDNEGDRHISSEKQSETDWEEISDEEYKILKAWVNDANSKQPDHYSWDEQPKTRYILLTRKEPIKLLIVEIIEEWKIKQQELQKQKEKEEEKKRIAKEKRDAKAAERKRQQLEKLKAELGES